jgi:hypothetical protein
MYRELPSLIYLLCVRLTPSGVDTRYGLQRGTGDSAADGRFCNRDGRARSINTQWNSAVTDNR